MLFCTSFVLNKDLELVTDNEWVSSNTLHLNLPPPPSLLAPLYYYLVTNPLISFATPYQFLVCLLSSYLTCISVLYSFFNSHICSKSECFCSFTSLVCSFRYILTTFQKLNVSQSLIFFLFADVVYIPVLSQQLLNRNLVYPKLLSPFLLLYSQIWSQYDHIFFVSKLWLA